MPPRIEIRPPRNRNEALAYGWTVLHSMAPVAQPTLDHVEAFIDRTGTDGIRVAMRAGEVLAGLVLLPMGQFYGGRSVPMTGVSAVAVAPEHRGSGVGTSLMRAALREMSRKRVALSTLYPATQPIYRRLGWEIAGTRAQWRVPTRALALGERRPPVRPMLAEDRAALHACHHEWARRRPGSLDRGAWAWRRVLESHD
jgi:predicted acetyltransferase